MKETLEKIAVRLNQMGFPSRVEEDFIEAEIPLPYEKDFVKPSFKLFLSEKQNLLFYKPNRFSTEKLLRKLKPHLKEIAEEMGLEIASQNLPSL